MSVIEEVRAEREDLARVLKKHAGIRRIVEDLYPDRAHFIYELLQNAEDAGATEARFTLAKTAVIFEHNGRAFEPRDIYAITDIGEGTKAEDGDKIGRFGVGFKAVFGYTETPHIWSPTFSFKITDLVLPTALPSRPELGRVTRFEFPFNNPKKDAGTSYAEVQNGLNDLSETTLLFLSHLESIRWQSDSAAPGEVLREKHSDNHFEVLKQTGHKTTSSSHFLTFERPVEGLDKQRIAIAFELDLLPNVREFDSTKALASQLKISPANPAGRVAVFFPAEKEASGLRFHLHAPFVPELSRASVKETSVNQPLFQQLASLSAESLHKIRDLGLLTVEFLSVLPNSQDQVPNRYQRIREAIINEMNTEPLAPTYSKSHAPAKDLLSAKAALKELLSDQDVEFLVDYDGNRPQWGAAAAQRNSNADRFLAGLAIKEWDIDEFAALLSKKTSEDTLRYISSPPSWVKGLDEEFMKWLSGKDVEWHQRLYALLYTEIGIDAGCSRLNNLKIVRLNDGKYSAGRKCFFPSIGIENDDVLPRVDKGVYSSGRNKTQQENARKFLEEVDVREVGEAEEVEAVLKRQYSSAAVTPKRGDLSRFVALVEKDTETASLFAKNFIFEGTDGKWHTPSQVFLDVPFSDTGLSAYYGEVPTDEKCVAIAESYRRSGVDVRSLVKFATAVGVKTRLDVIQVSCDSNPEWLSLSSVGGSRSSTAVNRDYTIPYLDHVLKRPSLQLSRLLWKTMVSLSEQPDILQATYQRSRSRGTNRADSQLVHILRTLQWIPQSNGSFLCPADASRDMLPGGFPFDPAWPWLEAIHFAEELDKKSEEQQQKLLMAKELGFSDAESLERAKRFAAIPADEQERILAELERRRVTLLPEREPVDRERRAQRVKAQAAEAPERQTEQRTRSVSVGREGVKEESEQYLREQYSIDEYMICQICKSALPFKLSDGSYYFEKVEFLTELKKRHYQNSLALCPNHSAMFLYANSSERLMPAFVELVGNELPVILAEQELTIYFTKTHMADLKAIIEGEGSRGSSDDVSSRREAQNE